MYRPLMNENWFSEAKEPGMKSFPRLVEDAVYVGQVNARRVEYSRGPAEMPVDSRGRDTLQLVRYTVLRI